jgi:hypothetical protein
MQIGLPVYEVTVGITEKEDDNGSEINDVPAVNHATADASVVMIYPQH